MFIVSRLTLFVRELVTPEKHLGAAKYKGSKPLSCSNVSLYVIIWQLKG